ncbi:hypothetical protein DXG01_004549 [Tephrocybe rancida]|nr:hypothetical protein DXG01_004549 [Tephrocybe rancida]
MSHKGNSERNAAVKIDMRRLQTPRSTSLQGYDTLPTLPSLTFDHLPHFFAYQGRIVDWGRYTYEFWSPNSKQLPFCPGNIIGGDLKLEPAEPIISRRTDGHKGHFDPTISPQLLESSSPWLPFTVYRRPEGISRKQWPETDDLLRLWKSDPPPARSTGCLPIEYLADLASRNEFLDKQIEDLMVIKERQTEWWEK